MNSRILDGVVVLDLTRFFSGPQCTLFLAGMGAEVIKIDDPETGDPTAFAPPFAGPQGVAFSRQTGQDMGIAYLKRARGKKSATLNLKSAEGRDVFLRMVQNADVVVDNFSAGVAERLGVGYAALKEANPRIVYCSLTGYGSTGPDRHLKAYDLMVQAAVGLMSITGQPGSAPTKAGSPMSDAIAGVFAALGIVSALLHRDRTGEGQSIDVSMADCLFSLIFDEPLDCYAALGLQPQQGNRIMRFSPFNAYRASDGWVTLGAATHDDWLALLEVMGRSDLKDNADMMSVGWRLAHNDQVDEVVAQWTLGLCTAEIEERLAKAKLACSPVRPIHDVLQWDQMIERQMAVPLWNPMSGSTMTASGSGFPIKFSGTTADYDRPAPLPGEHSDEVLTRLAGLNAQQITALREGRVV
ncbi:MAG: CoA transferase [Rubrivivax sp.]|nr:MAG: CoA transferase [Rubrivivax sp.]